MFLIQVNVLLGNWQQVLNYYSKAEATQEMADVRTNVAMDHYYYHLLITCTCTYVNILYMYMYYM